MALPDNGGPLWSKDEHDTYWLLFPNKHALPLEEIREIFSEFGKVKNVTAAGDERGFRFIQYTSLDDVERAVVGIKEYPQIKLLPHRPKNKRTVQNNTSPVSNSDNYQRNLFQRKPVNDAGSVTEADAETSNVQDKGKVENGTFGSDYFKVKTKKEVIDLPSLANGPSTKKLFSKLQNLSNIINPCKPKDDEVNSSTSDDKDEISDIATSTTVSPLKPPKKVTFSEKDTVVPNINFKSGDDDEVPLSVTNTNVPAITERKKVEVNLKIPPVKRVTKISSKVEDTDITNTHSIKSIEDEVPSLISNNKVPPVKQPKKIFLKSDDVIVANIHDDYGSAYILHLFEPFEPLAITHIKTLPNNATRYCHVYFKKQEDSIGVEKIFDKHDLAGKKLVVLRSCRLVEEDFEL